MPSLTSSFVFLAAALFSLPGGAACIDIGTEPFLANVETVTLCLKSNCEVAVRTRSCGNVHYLSADYSSATGVWLFRTRFHDPQKVADDEHVILYQPVDGTFRPLAKVNGADVWMLDFDRPMNAVSANEITCVRESAEEACEFIDGIAKGLRDRLKTNP